MRKWHLTLLINISQTRPITLPPKTTSLASDTKHPSVLPRYPSSLGSEESLSLNLFWIHLPFFLPAADTHCQILNFFLLEAMWPEGFPRLPTLLTAHS